MPVPVPRDDLGFPVDVARPVSRVLSLVPSLTESVAVTRPEALAGATIWCTHPAGLDVPRVRGTKNPDLSAIARLSPGLVLANQEENRRVDVERLRAAGVPVWVTAIRTLDEALASLRRMFTEALGWPEPPWLADAARAWRQPPPGLPVRAAIPIWRDPWMVVGSATFSGDLAGRLGLANVYGDHAERYPHVSVDDIGARQPDLIVLPDEPYAFSASDGPEAFPGRRVALVEGRSLTWYGPSLVAARSLLEGQLGPELPGHYAALVGYAERGDTAAGANLETAMRTPSWLAPVSVVLMSATLAACSSGSKPDTAPPVTSSPVSSTAAASPVASASAPSASTSGPGAAGASGEIDACTLLTKAQASAQTGKQYTSAVAKTIASGQDQCTYNTADDSEALDVIVYQPSSGVTWQMMTSVLSGAGGVKPVSGVGDKAMIGQIELDVQTGQRLVAVQGAGGLLTGDYSGAMAVAKTVITALP